MTCIGIIANPASGKDIRRLVAHGSVFDNEEKVSIVRRVLLGLDAVGVSQVWFMPDRFGIGLKALDGISPKLQANLLDFAPRFTQEDSRRAAQMMVEAGVRCIVTLGGDGTNRMVSKGCGATPLMPISTGTNNVFPYMIEATIAGLAAGLVAVGQADGAVWRAPCVEVLHAESDQVVDLALVDAVLYAERFVAARAVWESAKIRALVLARAEPGNIGLSSIGGHLLGGDYPSNSGLFLLTGLVGRPGITVQAPIAPGLMRPIHIREHRLLAPGDLVALAQEEPCVLALDGEREIELPPGSTLRLRLSPHGPYVVDARKAIELAARAGFFRDNNSGRPLPGRDDETHFVI
jgi:hypothetical protein